MKAGGAAAALHRIVHEYGRDVVDDPLRVEGLLRDLAAGHRREVFLLVQAVRTGVVQALIDAAPSAGLVGQQCVRRLQDDLGLAPDAAAWTVATWAEVLGVTDVVTAASPAVTGREPTPEERLVAVEAHVLNGRRRRALQELNDFVDRNADDPVALAVRADVLRMLKRNDLALADAEAALAVDPTSAVALRVRGEVHRRRGELADALTDLDRALELEPDSPQALLSRGEAYKDSDRPELALADLDRAIAVAPGPEAYALRSALHAQQERHEEALADVKRAFDWGASEGDASLPERLQRVQQRSRDAIAVLRRAGWMAPAARRWMRQKWDESRDGRDEGSGADPDSRT
jgi:tetratricopeptide (TPR) repeat protein